MAAQTGGIRQWFATIVGTFKLLFRKETPWSAKLALIAAAVYVLSPYDLLPDWLLGLGIIDDFAVVSLFVWFVRRLIGSNDDTA